MIKTVAKKLVILVTVFRLLVCGLPAQAVENTQTNAAGLTIPVRFQFDIDTQGLEEGNALPIVVTEDVYYQGIKIFEKNNSGVAFISELKSARMFGRGGKIRVTNGEITDLNGVKHQIVLTASAGGSYKLSSPAGVLMGASTAYKFAQTAILVGSATGIIFSGGLLLVPLAFLMKKGNEAKLSKGKIMFAQVVS